MKPQLKEGTCPVKWTERILTKWQKPWLIHICFFALCSLEGTTILRVLHAVKFIQGKIWMRPELPAHADYLHFLLLFLGIGIKVNCPVLPCVLPCSIHFLQNSLESGILGSLFVLSGHYDNRGFLAISG